MTGLLKVAGVGCGYFSQFHFEAWKRLPVDLVAVCDKDSIKAKEFASKFQVETFYDDINKMLRKQTLDLLDIVLPPNQHSPTVMLALEHGVKNLICQKPFTDN